MSTTDYINVSLEIWGCVMSFVVAVCLLVSKAQHNTSTKAYCFMLFTNMGTLLSDACAYIFRGHSGTFAWWGVRISNFSAFFFNYLLLGACAWYLISYLAHKTKVTRLPLYLVWGLCGLSVVLLIINQFFSIWYYIDSNNEYHRLGFFGISIYIGIITMAIFGFVILKYRHALNRQEKLAFGIYIIAPTIAMIIQSYLYGIVILGLVNTTSLVIIFLFLQAEQGRKLAEQENQLTQSRISVMLSQIQTHFLYNSLNSIYYLCEKDPVAAQKAIGEFSDYLRGNLDSIKRTAPVTFEQELRHIQIYLSLEKMRFDDDLNVVYDIEVTSFLLPTLTVQPLVENAVKYGVGKAEHGGTVTLRTRELPDCFEIEVTDDGVGYIPDKLKDDGRTHIGIENVRQRIEAICHGTLEIKGEKGIGTTAVIRLPKGEKYHDNSCS